MILTQGLADFILSLPNGSVVEIYPAGDGVCISLKKVDDSVEVTKRPIEYKITVTPALN